jgi:predicted nucleic acid-binding protein
MRLVLDASVAVAALRPSEPAHGAAAARILRLLNGDDTAVLPALFAIEVRGTLARLGFDRRTSVSFVDALARAPHEVVTIGPRAANAAARVAARCKLRGSDACYVWLAQRESIPLCKLDEEMALCGKAVCSVMEP